MEVLDSRILLALSDQRHVQHFHCRRVHIQALAIRALSLTQTVAYSGFMDITLALLPWHILWGLSMNKKEKLSALAAMSMGIL